MSIRIEERTGRPCSRGPQVVRVLHDFVIPAVPLAFRTGIEAIEVSQSSSPQSREAGRLVRNLDGDVRIELFPDVVLRGRSASLLSFDVYLGACLAHVLLPLLVRAREIRRHGVADDEVVRVAGERLAQETLATAFRDHVSLSHGFVFRAMEPILLEERSCRNAGNMSLLRLPTAILSALIHVRTAIFLMVADLLLRFTWSIDMASSELDVVPELHLVGLVYQPAAAYILAVYLLHDFVIRMRSGKNSSLALGPIFAGLWPLGLLVSWLSLPLSHELLFGDPLQTVVQGYVFLTYVVLALQSITSHPSEQSSNLTSNSF